MYEDRTDWKGDFWAHELRVHYRLYLSSNGHYSVICVQSDDYLDYDARLILSPDGWYTESEAENELLKYISVFEQVNDTLSHKLDNYLRLRLLAKAIRQRVARYKEIFPD